MKGQRKYLEEKTHYLYVLRDPFDMKIKYVGITNNISTRKKVHVHMLKGTKENTKMRNWFNLLKIKGGSPIFEIIKKFDDKTVAHKMEIILINKLGDDLLNIKNNGL